QYQRIVTSRRLELFSHQSYPSSEINLGGRRGEEGPDRGRSEAGLDELPAVDVAVLGLSGVFPETGDLDAHRALLVCSRCRWTRSRKALILADPLGCGYPASPPG